MSTPMTPRIHIFTASRTLALYDDAHTRVLRVLDAQLALHPYDVLVVGDAHFRGEPSPDTWAAEWGRAQRLEVRVYEAQSGELRTLLPDAEPVVSRWIEPAALVRIPPHKRPLRRNAVMVRDALAADPNARMSAFVDPSSPTQGTQHTVRQVPATRRHELVTVYRWAGTAHRETTR